MHAHFSCVQATPDAQPSRSSTPPVPLSPNGMPIDVPLHPLHHVQLSLGSFFGGAVASERSDDNGHPDMVQAAMHQLMSDTQPPADLYGPLLLPGAPPAQGPA